MIRNRLPSYVVSAVAVGITVIAVAVVATWCLVQTRRLGDLNQQIRENELRKQQYAGFMAQMQDSKQKKEALQKDIDGAMRRFAARNGEGAQLVAAVVKATSSAGIKMTGTSECPVPAGISGTGGNLNAVSYRFQLSGSYAGVARFFQGLPDWSLICRVESISMGPAPRDDKGGEVIVELVLSAFSINS